MLDARDWAWILVVFFATLVIASTVCALVGYVIQRDTLKGAENVFNTRRERNGGRMIVVGSMVAFASALGLIVALLLTLRPL